MRQQSRESREGCWTHSEAALHPLEKTEVHGEKTTPTERGRDAPPERAGDTHEQQAGGALRSTGCAEGDRVAGASGLGAQLAPLAAGSWQRG